MTPRELLQAMHPGANFDHLSREDMLYALITMLRTCAKLRFMRQLNHGRN